MKRLIAFVFSFFALSGVIISASTVPYMTSVGRTVTYSSCNNTNYTFSVAGGSGTGRCDTTATNEYQTDYKRNNDDQYRAAVERPDGGYNFSKYAKNNVNVKTQINANQIGSTKHGMNE